MSSLGVLCRVDALLLEHGIVRLEDVEKRGRLVACLIDNLTEKVLVRHRRRDGHPASDGGMRLSATEKARAELTLILPPTDFHSPPS